MPTKRRWCELSSCGYLDVASLTPMPQRSVGRLTQLRYLLQNHVGQILDQVLRPSKSNFGELRKAEVRRIPLPRTPVNKGKQKAPPIERKERKPREDDPPEAYALLLLAVIVGWFVTYLLTNQEMDRYESPRRWSDRTRLGSPHRSRGRHRRLRIARSRCPPRRLGH